LRGPRKGDILIDMQGLLDRPPRAALPRGAPPEIRFAKTDTETALGGGGVFIYIVVSGDRPLKYTDPDGKVDEPTTVLRFNDGSSGSSSSAMSDPIQSPNTEALEVAVSSIIGFDVSETPTVGEGISSAMNVVSTYSGVMGYIAEGEGLVTGAAGALNNTSTITGIVAVIPSVTKAITDPSVDSVSVAAGSVAGIAAGFPLGLIGR
jgi:hypothetical protein